MLPVIAGPCARTSYHLAHSEVRPSFQKVRLELLSDVGSVLKDDRSSSRRIGAVTEQSQIIRIGENPVAFPLRNLAYDDDPARFSSAVFCWSQRSRNGSRTVSPALARGKATIQTAIG